jgi:hypothetical protein
MQHKGGALHIGQALTHINLRNASKKSTAFLGDVVWLNMRR